MQILWVVFASSRQINKQKVIEKINLPYTGNKVFVTYQTQGGSNPKSPLAHPWLHPHIFLFIFFIWRGFKIKVMFVTYCVKSFSC